MSARVCYFDVCEEYLVDLLHLPKGTRIISVRMSDTVANGWPAVRFMASGDTIPEIPDNSAVPVLSPWFTAEIPKTIEEAKPVIKFKDWQ